MENVLGTSPCGSKAEINTSMQDGSYRNFQYVNPGSSRSYQQGDFISK